jgi:hypothetical protein
LHCTDDYRPNQDHFLNFRSPQLGSRSGLGFSTMPIAAVKHGALPPVAVYEIYLKT